MSKIATKAAHLDIHTQTIAGQTSRKDNKRKALFVANDNANEKQNSKEPSSMHIRRVLLLPATLLRLGFLAVLLKYGKQSENVGATRSKTSSEAKAYK